jgi:uncharacterized membrane protein YhiD involved in acid resistance
MPWHVSAIGLIVALLFGAFIGAERQWRQRMAGLRTNARVAAGAAMFVMMGGLIADKGSQGRVAAYVVSGIGFATLTSTGRQNLLLEQLVSRLSLEVGVTRASWEIVGDHE